MVDKQSYVLGLIDGEGCFGIVIRTGRKRLKLPFRPQFSLRVQLRKGNMRESLKIAEEYFNAGKIYKVEPEGYQYVVADFGALQRIRRLLQKDPPIVKRKQFTLWSKGIDLWKPLHDRNTPARVKAKTILKLAYLRDEISRTAEGKIRWRKWTYDKLKRELEKELGSSISSKHDFSFDIHPPKREKPPSRITEYF